MPPTSLLPYQQLLAQALALRDSYEQMKQRFDGFPIHAAELSKQGPVPDVVIEKNAKQPQFDAVYLGRQFRFELKLQANHDGNAIGVVLCSEVLGKTLDPVHQFTINENGDTNVKPPDSNEPIDCDVRRPAWYLLLNAMHEGLKK
jgi:hypothetical protein